MLLYFSGLSSKDKTARGCRSVSLEGVALREECFIIAGLVT